MYKNTDGWHMLPRDATHWPEDWRVEDGKHLYVLILYKKKKPVEKVVAPLNGENVPLLDIAFSDYVKHGLVDEVSSEDGNRQVQVLGPQDDPGVMMLRKKKPGCCSERHRRVDWE